MSWRKDLELTHPLLEGLRAGWVFALSSPSESDVGTSTLCQLLHAYELAMLEASRLPLFVLVPTAPLRPGFAGRLAQVPRPRWFLRWFLTRHIRRTLEALGRRYNARAAFGTLPPAMRRDQEAAQSYLDSLPPTGPGLSSCFSLAQFSLSEAG